MELQICNSFTRVVGMPQDARDLVTQVLTYQNDIEADKANVFHRIRMINRFGLKKKKNETDQELQQRIYNRKQELRNELAKLEANEWVCWFQNDVFPTGHLNIVRATLESLGTKFKEVDHRENPGNDLILKWNNEPWQPRYYQKDMIELGLKEHRGVFEAAVGTGKSLVMGRLIKELSNTSLIVVPSIGLGGQLEVDFTLWFGSRFVDYLTTEKIRSGRSLKPIRIVTIHTLASLQKSGELQQAIGDVKALYIDEIHHAGAASYLNLLPEIDHIYYRFGFTGTFLRNDHKTLDMWGFLSNVLYRYPAHKATEEGFLTPIEVLVHKLPGIRANQYRYEYNKNYCGNPDMLNQLHKIHSWAGRDQQILVLVKNKAKSGHIIHEFFNAHQIENSYISGDNSKEEINSTIRAFNEKKVKVLIGSSVIGEGIDIRSTDHLAMCQGGKSEIAIVQATGRLARLFDGKSIGYLHDFDFENTKYMKKHLKQRFDIYARNFECPIKYVSI